MPLWLLLVLPAVVVLRLLKAGGSLVALLGVVHVHPKLRYKEALKGPGRHQPDAVSPSDLFWGAVQDPPLFEKASACSHALVNYLQVEQR